MRKIMNNTEGSLGLSQRMSFVSTAVLIILMLCYLIMTISNSTSLADQTEIISNHPFEVVISAGDVKLYVSEMSLRTGRLVRHFSGDDVAFARTKLEELEHSLDIPGSRNRGTVSGRRERRAGAQGYSGALADGADGLSGLLRRF